MAFSLARAGQLREISGDKPSPLDPDLARLIDAWPNLLDSLRKGILAMVDAART